MTTTSIPAAADRAEALWRWVVSELGGRPVPELLITIGLGDGLLLEGIARHAPEMRVLALEPDRACAQACLSTHVAAAWRHRGQLVYLVDPDYDGAEEAWRLFPTGQTEPVLLVHPDVRLGEGVARAARAAKRILFGVKANAEARRRFAPRYLTNSIRNIPTIARGSDVRSLANAYRGVPAFIAAAGPSLDNAIGVLREARGRALVIAADTALRPLLLSDIAPHLVVGLDPGELNLRHFLALPECRHTWLVAESALDPVATAAFDERTLWFRAAPHQPWPWLNERGIDVGQLDVWGSVLTGAFSLACLAGCDPIILVGADLAYTEGRPYARGTAYEFTWALSAARGVGLSDTWRTQIAGQPAIRVPDLRGVETLTSGPLVSFRDWMVSRIRRSGRRVINATGEGILFGDGIEQRDARRVLPQNASVPGPARYARRLAGVSPAALAADLRRIAETLARDDRTAAPLPAWVEFSGGQLDAASVRAALEEAANALVTKRGKPAADPGVSWSRLAASPVTRDLLFRLPETIQRLREHLEVRSTLSNVAAGAAHRTELLDSAIQLFHEIADRVLRGPDVETVGDVISASTLVSGAFRWREPVLWGIQALEGLMGLAWSSAGASDTPRVETSPPFSLTPFFSRGVQCDGVPVPNAVAACGRLAEQLADCFLRGTRETFILHWGDSHESGLMRRLTGTVRSGAPVSTAREVRLERHRRLKAPRVLTEAGLPPSLVAYQRADGAVCVPRHLPYSLLVRPDGSVTRHHTWPRPIIFELPLGDGAIAWSNGLANFPEVAAAYVMYRHGREDHAVVERIPVRPSLGWWWRGRLYWSCLPAPVEDWVGLAAWAPGVGVTKELSGITVFDGVPAGDDLLLAPCTIGPGPRFERKPLAVGWTWQPGRPLQDAALGANGAASCSARNGRWTATAYAESDLVEFVSESGHRVAMNCHHPLRVAWSGSSLLVSTPDREVLLFELMLDALEEHAFAEGGGA